MNQSDIFLSFALFEASLKAGKLPRGEDRERTLDELAREHYDLLKKYE